MTTDASLGQRDEAARRRALDVRQSFLVQAPAGSGKTGLLIQRVLALLAVVDRPESILAMTFTRKAAAEMRERVLRALRDAAADTAVDPSRAYDVATRDLARAALRQDARHDWQLIANPSRLKVLTIDALAASFARQTPITTGLGALPAFVDDATAHYEEAIADALVAARAADPHWRDFLLHLDNDATTAVALLGGMLAKRDQWLRLPIGAPDAQLREVLEAALRRETDAALVRLVNLMPEHLAEALPELEAYAAQQLATEGLWPRRAALLALLADSGGLPPHEAAALDEWRELADWLLVKNDARFRVALNRNVGFPAKEKSAPEREEATAAMKAWLADACAVPGLCDALHAVRTLPPPHYTDQAWAFVAATLALLPTLASHLQLVFARTGETDFSEASLRALTALGNAENPGDLLLAADLRIAHVLVDEFQDTSVTQLDLIDRLTSGWDDGDGRTLFAVGDPMQSIYRFREAEVRNFLDANAAGRINNVAVQCLTLARNFRSCRPVVAWVNDVFPQVLAPAVDAARGEVAYEPVLATLGTPDDPLPTVDLAVDDAAEAAIVVRHVRAALAEGAADIAILVRARSHLDAILPALRAARIPYAAVDLESLAERLPTRDLLTLTRALTQPDDRVAAFALLRTPWCALALSDLLVVAGAAVKVPVLAAVGDAAVAARLSVDGQARIARLRRALAPALATRGRTTLVARVRAAWLALGGPACVDDALDLDGAERYFGLLARHERGGDLADWPAFAVLSAKLFAEAPPDTATVLQVMTLHRAKGLEFDTVILPGLARGTRHGDDPPLRWQLRVRAGGERALLLAPLHARIGATSAPDPVYMYLKALDAEAATAELGRLLYVGCTRARRRLHLVGAPSIKAETPKAPARWSPAANSALLRLWPAIDGRGAPPVPPAVAVNDVARAPVLPPVLARLPLAWSALMPLPSVPVTTSAVGSADGPLFDWAQATAAAIGTVTHRLLTQLAHDGIAAWSAARVSGERARIVVELAGEGVDAALRDTAADAVLDAMTRTLADERGQWLFAPGHEEARSEWALAAIGEHVVEHVTLDRSFVADGLRWIVDFKTGRHEGGDAEAFLAREVERYRPQLERYARIVGGFDSRPIRLALYFPRVAGGWRAWPFVPADPVD